MTDLLKSSNCRRRGIVSWLWTTGIVLLILSAPAFGQEEGVTFALGNATATITKIAAGVGIIGVGMLTVKLVVRAFAAFRRS